MTNKGLLRALSSATGARAAAIERELSRRGIAAPDIHTQTKTRTDAPVTTPDWADDHSASASGLQGERFPELPGHKIDALVRQRPDYTQPGRVTNVERIAVSVQRIKRDAIFRDRVLARYGNACAICGYAVHVEAAHLTPKYQISDDRVENGAPLCPNHHWELDHGILSVDQVRSMRDMSQVRQK